MIKAVRPLGLFGGFGIEIEYAIVNSRTLDIEPFADTVLSAMAGPGAEDAYFGACGWSNELVLHVLELKTLAPPGSFAGLLTGLRGEIARAHNILGADRRLMPGAMHPWMDPLRESRLWPGETGEIYRAFNRIFDCRGHGWSNLQSLHLNLPFSDDEEFGRLHAAIRVLLPIIPALAASSPIVDGRVTGALDNRMQFYRTNAQRVPQVAGMIIPERASSAAEYRARILEPLFAAIAPHDPEGILREEWLNARGAIARFQRNAIEIRVIDSQECPSADLAVAWLIIRTLECLCSGADISRAELESWEPEPLRDLFLRGIVEADQCQIGDPRYLALFGHGGPSCTAGELWAHIFSRVSRADWQPEFEAPLVTILSRGPLARRILDDLGANSERERLRGLWSRLCDCLLLDRPFIPCN